MKRVEIASLKTVSQMEYFSFQLTRRVLNEGVNVFKTVVSVVGRLRGVFKLRLVLRLSLRSF